MKRFVILCWLVAASATALILFQIKQEVRGLEDEIAATQREILRDQEAVHVLEAEWSYLNSPARIAALAERHLGLAPIPAERVVGFDDLPLPGAPEDAPHDALPGEDAPHQQSPATLVTAPAGDPNRLAEGLRQ
jgi:cell division protein FtsL